MSRFVRRLWSVVNEVVERAKKLVPADPLNPNNATVQYTGYLADYTQNFIAIFNVEHPTTQQIVLELPKAREACPHNLAPTTSSLMQLALGDCLAIALLESKGLRKFRPLCYLTDEWGCPSGEPVIGIPFYLADPSLHSIEAELGMPVKLAGVGEGIEDLTPFFTVLSR